MIFPFSLSLHLLPMITMIYIFLYVYSIIPFPFYSGFGIDTRNIGFILSSLVLFPLIYFIAGFESKSMNFNFLFISLSFGLLTCFIMKSLFLFFIFYDCLLIALLLALVIFIPNYYRIRTSFFFFVFSTFGSLIFILSIGFILSSNFLFSLLILFPFFIKLPSFPFFYWLPEVHCEANSSIPLFLAGLLLKLSIYGILRFILSSFFLSLLLWLAITTLHLYRVIQFMVYILVIILFLLLC